MLNFFSHPEICVQLRVKLCWLRTIMVRENGSISFFLLFHSMIHHTPIVYYQLYGIPHYLVADQVAADTLIEGC